MSKIVQAVNAMIANPKLIGEVSGGHDGELFFKYMEKYLWSMRVNDETGYFLYFYPGKLTISQLVAMDPSDWVDFDNMVVYRADEIGTKEARASFAELYTLLNEKRFGINEALDDIIDSDIPY